MSVRAPRHYPSLDGLRGLAILLVIPCNANITPSVLHGPLTVFTLLIDRGWIGVQLFFVLSGFLITEQLYTSRHASNYYGGFYARRMLRILPLYIAAVAVSLLIIKVLGGQSHVRTGASAWVTWLGLFFINWIQPLGRGIPAFPQFWSLAVEEQFYLIWPLVVRSCASRLLAVTAALAALSLALRILMQLTGAAPDMLYMWTICRMDALAYGAIAALIVQRWRARDAAPAPWAWVGGGLAIALIGALSTHLYAGDTGPTQTAGYTCLGLAFMLILLGAVASDLSSRPSRGLGVLRTRVLRSVGRYSYGMYASHMFFVIFAAAWLRRIAAPFADARMLVCSLVVIVLSYGVGWLSYHLIEKHFLKLGRFFAPTRPAASNIVQRL